MRHGLISVVSFLALVNLCTAAHAAPATQPAREPAKVLILPFVPIDSAPGLEWFGRGIVQTLQADLSRNPALQPMTVDPAHKESEPPAGGFDTAAALKVARAMAAQYVVFGTFQSLNGDARISGIIADADSGRSIGGIKTTGSMRAVFDLQDDVSHQVRRALVDAGVIPPPAPGSPPAYDDEGPLHGSYGSRMDTLDSDAANSMNSLRLSSDYVEPYGYYGGGYPYYYGDYGYPGYGPVYGYPYWPWWGFGAIIFHDDFDHHHHHDDHHDDHHGDSHHDGSSHHDASVNHNGSFAHNGSMTHSGSMVHAGSFHHTGAPAGFRSTAGFRAAPAFRSAGAFRGGSAGFHSMGGFRGGMGGGGAMHAAGGAHGGGGGGMHR